MMRAKKKMLNVIVLAVILIVMFFFGYFIYVNFGKAPKQACVSDKACFDIEIASTVSEREKGLSGKNSLDNASAMLFVFEQESLPGFWMKDMNFPLDIIWISRDFKIIGIEKNLQPCSLESDCPVVYPRKEIMYVLEINSGLSDAYSFEVNDSVYF